MNVLNNWIKNDPLKFYEKKLKTEMNNFDKFHKKISDQIDDEINKAFIFASELVALIKSISPLSK